MRYKIGVRILLLLYLVIAVVDSIDIASLWRQTMQHQKYGKQEQNFLILFYFEEEEMNRFIIMLISSSD
jgi:hypothetical protein